MVKSETNGLQSSYRLSMSRILSPCYQILAVTGSTGAEDELSDSTPEPILNECFDQCSSFEILDSSHNDPNQITYT